MLFLADESCDFAVVRALRTAGHEVRAIAEETSRSEDAAVILLAASEHRILLTEDKDFGWLTFVARAESEGVILVRFPGTSRHALARSIVDLVSQEGDRLKGSFTVMRPGQSRITPRRR